LQPHLPYIVYIQKNYSEKILPFYDMEYILSLDRSQLLSLNLYRAEYY
jgi:hypothetical protein